MIPENSSTANTKDFLQSLCISEHQTLSMRFDETSCGNSVNNFDCQAFSLLETVTGGSQATQAHCVSLTEGKVKETIFPKSSCTY